MGRSFVPHLFMALYERCAYHGWRFDSDGKCLKIPQSKRSGKDEAQVAACAKAYPTQVKQSMWGAHPRAFAVGRVLALRGPRRGQASRGSELCRMLRPFLFPRHAVSPTQKILQSAVVPSEAFRGCILLQVAQGMIWVWGDNGRDAGLESALTPAALVPELIDAEALKSGKVVALSPYVRDLPYAWETLMENLVVSSLLARDAQLSRHRCPASAIATALVTAGAVVHVPVSQRF